MKDFYELFNQIDGEADSYPKEDLSDFEKARMKRNASLITQGRLPRQSFFQKTACACAVLFLAFMIAFRHDAVQAAVENMTNQLYYYFGSREEVIDYVTVVNRSYKNQGFQIALTEAAVDSSNLILAFKITSDRPLTENGEVRLGSEELLVNGRKLVSESCTTLVTQLDPKNTQMILSLRQEELYKQKELNIDYKIRSIFYGDGRENQALDRDFTEVKGKWDFHFTIDTKGLAKETKILDVNQTVKAENGMYLTVKKFKISPMEMSFQTEEKKIEKDGIGYYFNVIAKDDKGNEIFFDMEGTDTKGSYYANGFEKDTGNCRYITLQVYLEQYKLSEEYAGEELPSKAIGRPIRIDFK